jgi:hypothetical protein
LIHRYHRVHASLTPHSLTYCLTYLGAQAITHGDGSGAGGRRAYLVTVRVRVRIRMRVTVRTRRRVRVGGRVRIGGGVRVLTGHERHAERKYWPASGL